MASLMLAKRHGHFRTGNLFVLASEPSLASPCLCVFQEPIHVYSPKSSCGELPCRNPVAAFRELPIMLHQATVPLIHVNSTAPGPDAFGACKIVPKMKGNTCRANGGRLAEIAFGIDPASIKRLRLEIQMHHQDIATASPK